MNWWRVIWFRGYVPSQAFVLWMACNGKLTTKEKLKRWGCINDGLCVCSL